MTWHEQDAVELRTYMARNPKFLEALTERRPKTTGTTLEERAVTGSDVKGFDDCLEALRELQTQVDRPTPETPYIP